MKELLGRRRPSNSNMGNDWQFTELSRTTVIKGEYFNNFLQFILSKFGLTLFLAIKRVKPLPVTVPIMLFIRSDYNNLLPVQCVVPYARRACAVSFNLTGNERTNKLALATTFCLLSIMYQRLYVGKCVIQRCL